MNLFVVTGATRGLGEALARRIAATPGAKLLTLGRAPADATHVEADLADAGQVERACAELERRIAGAACDRAVLINNAGVVEPVAPLENADPEALRRNVEVNLVAPLLLMRCFLRATAAIPLRRIVNISSGAGRRPISGWGAYCATKAGLDMATRVVELEARSRGLAVHACSLAPGVVDTDMQATVRGMDAADFADVERFRAMKAQGALRPADEVAADILRLEAEGRLDGEALRDLRELVASGAPPRS